MRVKVQAGALREAIEQVRTTTEPSNPAFAGLYFEASHRPDGTSRIRLFTMKPLAKTLIAVAAEVEEEGTVMVRPDQILSGLNGHAADAVVSFNVSDKVKRLNGTCGGSRFNAVLLSGGPMMKEQIARLPIHGTNGSRYSATILADVIKKAAWCTSKTNLNASVIDSLDFKRTELGYKVLATDGHVAVRVTVNSDLHPEEMTIPKVGLNTFGKLIGKHAEDEIHVIKGQPQNGEYNELYFRWGSVFFGASMSSLKPASIEPIFANELWQPTRIVIVSRSILLGMLGRMAGFADKDNPIITFSLKDEKLKLSSSNVDGDCVEQLDIAYTGDSKYKSGKAECSVAFRYITQILEAISNDLVTIGIRDASTHLVVCDEGNDEVNARWIVSCVRPITPEKTKLARETEGGTDEDALAPADLTAEDVPETIPEPVAVPVQSEGWAAPATDAEVEDPFADLEDTQVAEDVAHEDQDDTIPV